MRKNIVQVTTTMNRGGLETLLLNVYSKLSREYKFYFIVQKRGHHNYFDQIYSLGGEIVGVYRETFLDYVLYAFKFYKALKNIDSTIIHSHIDTLSGIPLFIAKRIGYVKRISHSHNSSQEINSKIIFKNLLKKMIKISSTNLASCSYEAGYYMFGKKSKFIYIPNGVDTSKFSFNYEERKRIRNTFNLNNRFVFGHVGRFNEQKNHEFLIYLIDYLRRIRSDIALLLVGDGPMLEKIKSQAIEFGVEGYIVFHPSTNDVASLYSAFDLFLFPSLFEGMPLALLEAQSANLNCIVSDTISNNSICEAKVIKLPIDKGVEEWGNSINFSNYDRTKVNNDLVNFLTTIDINYTASEFEKLYRSDINE